MYEVKIPKEIKVGGMDYSILMDTDTDKELDDANRRGEHSDLQRRLRIHTQYSPQETSSTFIHECCHAIDCVYCGGELSELQVTNIANGLHQVLEQLGIRFVK